MSRQSSENEGVHIIAEFDDGAIALSEVTAQPGDETAAVTANVLSLVVLYTSDPQRVANFYALLGIHFEREQHGTGAEHLAGRLGSQVLEIYPQSGNIDSSSVRLGFGISSVEAAVNAVRQAGGSVVSEPRRGTWGYRAILADPDGRRVEIVQSPNGTPNVG